MSGDCKERETGIREDRSIHLVASWGTCSVFPGLYAQKRDKRDQISAQILPSTLVGVGLESGEIARDTPPTRYDCPGKSLFGKIYDSH